MLTQARLSLLPPGRPTSHPNTLECTTPESVRSYILGGSFGRFANRPYQVREPPLLDDGLGQDPEAGYGVEDHKNEHRELAPEGAQGRAGGATRSNGRDRRRSRA